MQDDYLIVPKLRAVKIKQRREIPPGYKLKGVTVSTTSTEKYSVSILYECEQNIPTIKSETFLGLDFSMKELYVASDGSSAYYPRYYRLALDKLIKESRKLSKMQKGSSNRNKQRIQVAAAQSKKSWRYQNASIIAKTAVLSLTGTTMHVSILKMGYALSLCLIKNIEPWGTRG